MELMVVPMAKKSAEKTKLTVSDAVFGVEYKQALVHQVLTAYQAGARAGTHAQKTRAEVSGGGRKPWRQKGTGRARAGSTRGPIWRSGGVTFASKTRDYAQKVNKKMYRAAMRSIVAELIREDRLMVVDDFKVAEPKTKLLKTMLEGMSLNISKERVLLVTTELDEALILSSRNLMHVGLCLVSELDPFSLVGCHKILMTQAAVTQLEETLA